MTATFSNEISVEEEAAFALRELWHWSDGF